MGLAPLDPFQGEQIKTNVTGVSIGWAQLGHFQVSAANAVASSNTAVHAAITLGAASADVTTAITNPTIPRSIIVKGNAAGITGNVVITGTNYAGDIITETIALNESTAVEGAKAFATVTKINVPAKTNANGDTVSVGFGNALGMPYLLTNNTVLKAYLGNTLESVAPTVAMSASAIESNTIKLNSALNGTAVDVYLIVA